MNCREGDLAIIVKSYAGNEGKIVKCVRYAGVINYTIIGEQPAWDIDITVYAMDGKERNYVADCFLRPILDSDKQDEMLSIVSLKEKVKA